MYIIVTGCGKIGAALADRLAEEGNDVAVVDRDEKSFTLLGSGCNCMVLAGMPIDEDILRQAGIEKADALAAVTQDDNTNIMTAQIARQLYRVPCVVACIDDEEKQHIYEEMGLRTICATQLAQDAAFDAVGGGRTV
ncbi:MAG: TrkA family potassium uptake protein [Oscillospiraceae bacterium]|nr:TrkA family potassium uptake protein [Oscillospiraceae bacterium]